MLKCWIVGTLKLLDVQHGYFYPKCVAAVMAIIHISIDMFFILLTLGQEGPF